MKNEYIKKQDVIDVVVQSYHFESDRMTALQELPVVTEEELREKANNERFNANYKIINSMDLTNSYGAMKGVVLGYNSKAPSPYVTWAYNKKNDSYDNGHYFSSLEAAQKDFIERGAECLSVNLREEYANENAMNDIEEALKYSFTDQKVKRLIQNEDFVAHAMHKYDNLDHSAENEALAESVEDLYNEMINDNKMFPLEFYDELEGKQVSVFTHDCDSLAGYIHFCKSMTDVFLEVNNEFRELNINSIGYIEVDGKRIFESNLFKENKTELEVASLDAKILNSLKLNEGRKKDVYKELNCREVDER